MEVSEQIMERNSQLHPSFTLLSHLMCHVIPEQVNTSRSPQDLVTFSYFLDIHNELE